MRIYTVRTGDSTLLLPAYTGASSIKASSSLIVSRRESNPLRYNGCKLTYLGPITFRSITRTTLTSWADLHFPHKPVFHQFNTGQPSVCLRNTVKKKNFFRFQADCIAFASTKLLHDLTLSTFTSWRVRDSTHTNHNASLQLPV